ncbi:MAG TPA: alpha/beta fold hydrolase [Acidimicrobiales bacterium]|nr:alpha/beta fold hydrolase [Acidimicrobiales bacterium]
MNGAWTWIETGRGARCRVLQQGPEGLDNDVVYFHGMGGLDDGDPFLTRLAERYRVHAPELPGYGESTGEERLEDMLDFTLHGWDVCDALGLERPSLVAHSMGGMIAAEMACVANERPAKLALLAPAGLWIDEHPVPDVFGMLPHHLPAVLFADPEKGAASLTRGADFTDQQALLDFFIGNAKRLGTAGKILFPIPNRRLSKRLYRLRAETLLVWGSEDKLLPTAPYSARWQELVPHASLVTVAGAGHMAPVEQPDAVAEAVEKFLG